MLWNEVFNKNLFAIFQIFIYSFCPIIFVTHHQVVWAISNEPSLDFWLPSTCKRNNSIWSIEIILNAVRFLYRYGYPKEKKMKK